jgi:hypothetical protein
VHSGPSDPSSTNIYARTFVSPWVKKDSALSLGLVHRTSPLQGMSLEA